MTSDKFIGSITNKVYNQIRKSSSDAEARRYLKEHQAKQLTLTAVVKSFYCIHRADGIKNSLCNVKQCKMCKALEQ